MDLFVSMRTFVHVVRAGSMNAAARQMGISGALAGQRISALEAHLQARLLNRSTRHQNLTEFGEGYFHQCLDILDLVALSEGQAEDQRQTPQGMLRITSPVSFGTEVLMPALPGFSNRAPDVEIEVILSDQNLDLIPDGIDAAFRIGALEDSTLMRKTLAPYDMEICAAPAYLAAHGQPLHPRDLDGHRAVLLSLNARRPWRLSNGHQTETWQPASMLRVNSGLAVRSAAMAGLGLAMLPRILAAPAIGTGDLINLLPDWRPRAQPMSLLYHRDRYMPSRLRCFLDFAGAAFA